MKQGHLNIVKNPKNNNIVNRAMNTYNFTNKYNKRNFKASDSEIDETTNQ